MSHSATVTLTIPNGGTDSPALSSVWSKGQVRSALGAAADLIVYAPAALTGAVTMQIRPVYASGAWTTLQSGGSDVAFPAGKSTQVAIAAFNDMRMHSAAGEGAARDMQVSIQINTDN